MSNNPGAGLGDPYWYEWTVGQNFVLDMLDPDSGIASVTLQKTGEKGLDDVVVNFTNGDARFIQVKHTRAGDYLTFGDLVLGVDDEGPLLRQIAAAWKAEVLRAPGKCEAWLITNRAVGRRRSSTKATPPILRPSLEEFLTHLRVQLTSATTISNISIPPKWQDAWSYEWLPQLDVLGSDPLKLSFLQHFQIHASEKGLDELWSSLITKIETLFSIDHRAAQRLQSLLDSALRVWATSLRGSSESITREAAYEKLCLVDDTLVGAHDLAPPAPFFGTRFPIADQVASCLSTRTEPVLFIVGEPGSGKTALLSMLANRREPVIDVRFHSYRPIAPDNQLLPADAGRTITPRALWSDLLLQIRALARGRLAHLQVPVHAGSLSVEGLRSHVLRLADALGKQEGRAFVIAIDGIDHAARAGFTTESFLDTLIAPSQVPPHVVFLIGGQPPEGYASYPAWLRSPTSGVRRIDIPRLEFSDTLNLVKTRLPMLPALDQDNVARDIWHHCHGHTLSTVFAAEEAVLASDDLSRLASILDERQLASGVEAYYSSIWSAVTRPFPSATSTRLAACLCLMPVRTRAATVQAILGLPDGFLARWDDVLRQLRPLVVEDPDGFRVFHNDVRVFLHRVLQADPILYKDCASRLADHLMGGSDALARHAAAQNLFGIAGRPYDRAAMFTPAYVLEGHAISRKLDELTVQSLIAAESLAEVEPDWDVAHIVAAGLRTLEQLRASLQWRDAEIKSSGSIFGVVPTKPAERRVSRRAEWNYQLLNAVLDDIAELHTDNEFARAVAAYRRWFEGLSPADVAAAVALNTEKPRSVADATATSGTLLAKLGEVGAALNILLPSSQYVNALGAGDAGEVDAAEVGDVDASEAGEVDAAAEADAGDADTVEVGDVDAEAEAGDAGDADAVEAGDAGNATDAEETDTVEAWDATDAEDAGDVAEANYAQGLFIGMQKAVSDRDFVRLLRRVRNFAFTDAQKLLTRLVELRAWRRCGLFLQFLEQPTESDPWVLRLQTATVAALLGNQGLRTRWVNPILESRATSIAKSASYENFVHDEADRLTGMSWIAMLIGIEEPNRDASATRAEIENVYKTKSRDDRSDEVVAQVLHASALLGSLIQSLRSDSVKAIHLSAEVVSKTIEVLVRAPEGDVYSLPHGFHNVAATLVRGLVECSQKHPAMLNAVCQVFIQQIDSGKFQGVFLETLWRTLMAAGHSDALLRYADRFIGAEGQAWEASPAERHDIIRRLAALLNESGVGKHAVAALARLPWTDVGYIGSKEYALDAPLQWFKSLARRKTRAWADDGLRLMALSRRASRTGDNRLSWDVEGEVLAAACIDGPCALAHVLQADSSLEAGDRSIVSGLLGMVERAPVDRCVLLAIWSYCTGQLRWQVDADRLAEVRDVLVTAGQRAGMLGLAEEMKSAAPAEFACQATDRGSEDRESSIDNRFDGLPTEEAMKSVCDAKHWAGVAFVLDRVLRQHPAETSIAVELAWSALSRRPERVWWLDGAGVAYKAIFPLVTASRRWEAIRHAVTSNREDVSIQRANTLAENLDKFCHIVAEIEGVERLELGLQRLLEMHELWLSGGVFSSRKSDALNEKYPTHTAWGPLFVELLLRLVIFDEQAGMQAALRGIHRLLTADTSLYEYTVTLVRAADPEVQRRFMLITEALTGEPGATFLRDWLTAEVENSPRLDVALGAWTALRLGCRRLGEAAPEWPPLKASNSDPSITVPVAPPLLTLLPSRKGMYTAVGRAATRILDQMEAALNMDVEALRAELAASINRDPPQRKPPLPRESRIGDMAPNARDEAELGRLFELLRVRERQGRFKKVPITDLAQVGTPFADPFILLQTPAPYTDCDSWPTDERLNALVESNDLAWDDELKTLIYADLPPHLHAIAGVLRTFSRKLDVRISLDHVVLWDIARNEEVRPAILNGRASLQIDAIGGLIARPGAQCQIWLMQTVGGLLPLVDATLDFFPTRIWKEWLEWEPDLREPLVWRRDGRRVAWYERLRGPVRRLYGGDFVYRQPTLNRWVCTTEEWERIASIVGSPERRIQAEKMVLGEQ